MSEEKLQQSHEVITAKSSTIPTMYSGIPCLNIVPCLNMLDQGDVVLKDHTKLKDIKLYQEVVSSKKCSTTTKKNESLTNKQIINNPTHFTIYVSDSDDSIVHEEIIDIPLISTSVTEILSPVACSMIEKPIIPGLLEFPRTITIISSKPTDLMLVSCIPSSIMSPYVQSKIDYELQFKIFNACNMLRNTTFMYEPNLVKVLPKIEHLKYSVKMCYNGKHISPSLDVFKITTGTQVTQSIKLKCVEKVSITKQPNVNGININYPYV
ncbi:uncharacterized protein LOC114124112 [Aphis gossypii]|nr:uncharacterized protein LOC114124112 [Aphis gossypii]